MRSQLGRKILAMLMCVASLISPVLSQDASKLPGSAVDAHGVRHYWREPGKKKAPWIEDAIKKVRPQYPYEAVQRHVTGSGLYRLTVDVNTGSVLKVTVVKSAGTPVLDVPSIDAFRKWRFKPGKWKEIDIPVVFTMAPRPSQPTAAAKPTPPQR